MEGGVGRGRKMEGGVGMGGRKMEGDVGRGQEDGGWCPQGRGRWRVVSGGGGQEDGG